MLALIAFYFLSYPLSSLFASVIFQFFFCFLFFFTVDCECLWGLGLFFFFFFKFDNASGKGTRIFSLFSLDTYRRGLIYCAFWTPNELWVRRAFFYFRHFAEDLSFRFVRFPTHCDKLFETPLKCCCGCAKNCDNKIGLPDVITRLQRKNSEQCMKRRIGIFCLLHRTLCR